MDHVNNITLSYTFFKTDEEDLEEESKSEVKQTTDKNQLSVAK